MTVGRPDRERGQEQLAATEFRGIRGDEADDEDGERDEVGEHEDTEQEQSRVPRPDEPAPRRAKEIDRQ